MDMNSSGLAKSQHMIILDEDFAQNLQTKSFRCSFCKRGFSNAQALGGHMNIHRKDRAKLREFSDEGLLSLEISTTAADCDEDKSSSAENDDQGSEDVGRAENLNFVKDTVPPRRLPLFEGAAADDGGERVERRIAESKYGSEVDLELRLGPEPLRHAKSKP